MLLRRAVALGACLASSRALVTLPAHLASGAILQTWRGSHTAAQLNGRAAPGEVVTVSTGVPGVPPFITAADPSGDWFVAYNWPPGPTDWDAFNITISGSQTPSPILLERVQFGDVVFCLGDGSALLPLALADGGAAWAAGAAAALKTVHLFPVAPAPSGACAWGAPAPTPGAPCGAWTPAAAPGAAAGFSALCLQTAVEATRARGFGGNGVVGVIALAANASAVEDLLPPAGVAAAAACGALPGGPPAAGAMWAVGGAPLASFPARYFVLALGGSDAARVGAAGGGASAAEAYGCRVRALVAGLRAGPRVGDSVALLVEPLAGAAPAPDAARGLWALRAGLATALPGAVAGVGASVCATALAAAADAGARGVVNGAGAAAGTNTTVVAARGGAALANVAWWAFDVAAAGPAPRGGAVDGAGGATISFAFAPDGSSNASTLALLPAPGCGACCAGASAAFGLAPGADGPWTAATPTVVRGGAALHLAPAAGGAAPAAAWARVGAAPDECVLVDATTGIPAPAFALALAPALALTPARALASTLAPAPARARAPRPSPPLLTRWHAAAQLAPGVAARRAFLVAAAARAADVAATPPARRFSGLAATPPRYFNSWQAWRCNLDESLFLRAGEVLVESGLAALNFSFVNSDDCEWRTERDAAGAVVPDGARFPSGFSALASALGALDPPVALGVYTSQTATTCVGRPASYEHEAVDAATWCAWGARFVKVDNCGGARYPALNTSWIRLRAALDECAHDVLLSVESCGSVGGCGAWIRESGAQMWRTTADLQLYWQSVMSNLDDNEKMAPLSGPGGWNDPDMLIVGHGILSPAEEQSHWAAWVISAAPLGLAFDVSRGVDAATLALVSSPEVLAVQADAAGVAGVRATPANATGAECWARPLVNGTAVLLFNRGDATADVYCAWADVAPHWPAGARAAVRDLWARADAGVFAGGYAARGLVRHASALVLATLAA